MPKYGFVELFKHKEKISKVSKHSNDEILEMLYELIRRIDFFDENSISVPSLQKSWSLVKDVDPKDMLFVALTIEMNGLLWTGDLKLRTALKEQGFDAFLKKNHLTTPYPFTVRFNNKSHQRHLLSQLLGAD
jgi:predicted nucleic acid-binding protein